MERPFDGLPESAMVRRIAAHDWSDGPFGPLTAWPDELVVLLRTLLQARQAMCLAMGPAMNLVYNDAYAAILGTRDVDGLGAPARELWSDIWPDVGADLHAALAGEARFVDHVGLDFQREEGVERRWFSFSLTPVIAADGAVLAVFASTVETTAMARTEAALQEQIAFVRNVFEKAPGFVAAGRGDDHVIEMANRAYRDLVGRDDLVGHAVRDALPELVDQGFLELLDQVRRTGERFQAERMPIDLRRGPGGALERRWVDFVCEPLLDAAGRVEGLLVQGQDVTTHVQQEAALRQALTRLEALFEGAADGLLVLDADGVVTELNPRAAAILGRARESVVGRHHREFLDGDEGVRVAERLEAVAQAPERLLLDVRRPDGAVVPVRVSMSRISDTGDVLVVGHDISEELRTRELLREAQRMESVGQLTGGIAHDFNNLLTVIIGATEVLAQERDGELAEAERRAIVEECATAARRGAELTRRLLTFARRQTLDPRPLVLPDVLESLRPMIRRTLPANITVEIDGGPGGTVRADPTELDSALLNLCINARDAMPAGGRLRLEVVEMDGERASGGRHPERFLGIRISDTGVGMDDEQRRRAVEPFYTTKPRGAGTGLGLSMVDGFAHQSGGGLRIESEPGRGTRITLWLPLADPEPVDPAVEGGAADAAARNRTRTVLVVEDDAMVARFLTGALERLGWTVASVPDAESALARLAGGTVPDLLLTDVMLGPGMDGIELARLLVERHPELPVVVTTGYADLELGGETPVTRVALLRKPFTMQELARLLDELERAG